MDDEEGISAFFQSLGLHSAQQEAAIRCCQEQLVLTVGDLRVVASEPEDLKELFPQLGVRARVKIWFKKERGEDIEVLTLAVPREVTVQNTEGGGEEEEEVAQPEETITTSPVEEAAAAAPPSEQQEEVSEDISPEPTTPNITPTKPTAASATTRSAKKSPAKKSPAKKPAEEAAAAAPRFSQLDPYGRTSEELATRSGKKPAAKKSPAKKPAASSTRKNRNNKQSKDPANPTAKDLRLHIRRGLDKFCMNLFQKDHGLAFTDKLIPDDLKPSNNPDGRLLETTCNFQKFLKAVATEMYLDDDKPDKQTVQDHLQQLQAHSKEWIAFLRKNTRQTAPVKMVHKDPPNEQFDAVGARQDHEDWQDGILWSLPKEHKAMFRQVGFAKWSMVYRPVMIVSPFGVPPLAMREQWLKLYESCANDKTLKEMGYLIWWIAPDQEIQPRAYSVIQQDEFVPYQDGKEKGYHLLPKTLQSMVDKKKPFNDKQREQAGCLTMLNHLAALEPDQRDHPWSDFSEEEWWWWGETTAIAKDDASDDNRKASPKRSSNKRVSANRVLLIPSAKRVVHSPPTKKRRTLG